ncbi:MAG: hypothetical protein PWR10_2451 [Halanaerobiales bacterium]|nr:hypothetical protein [Halanaerobiales bacterium]
MGFLPFKNTIGDRIFVSVVSFIGIHLLWMRFVETLFPLWGATVISVILGFVIIKWG